MGKDKNASELLTCLLTSVSWGFERCWLLELAQNVPKTWTLEGFDVSDLQYPAAEYLPGNVSLRVWDAFGDLPEEMRGRFDVVHVRAFCTVVKNGDPSVLIKNLMAILSMCNPSFTRSVYAGCISFFFNSTYSTM